MSTPTTPADSGPLMGDPEGCLTLDQAAALLCVSRRSVQREIKRKRLHAVRVGARVVIARAELARYLSPKK